MIQHLTKSPSIISNIISDLRCVKHQTNPFVFRHNLERFGFLAGYEVSKVLDYTSEDVETSLGVAKADKLDTHIVVASILRAGLPMHQGLLNAFEYAGNAFVSAYRKHSKDGNFDIHVEYVSCPSLDGCTLILADPMLATGSSMIKSLEALKPNGTPKEIHIVTAIAAREGLDYVRRLMPKAHIWVGAIDEELTAKAYIVPGLGDAGDLAFGPKLQE